MFCGFICHINSLYSRRPIYDGISLIYFNSTQSFMSGKYNSFIVSVPQLIHLDTRVICATHTSSNWMPHTHKTHRSPTRKPKTKTTQIFYIDNNNPANSTRLPRARGSHLTRRVHRGGPTLRPLRTFVSTVKRALYFCISPTQFIYTDPLRKDKQTHKLQPLFNSP